MPKRGERAAPPAPPEGWELRFATSEAATGWEELYRTEPRALWVAWETLSIRPTEPINRSRQHRLKDIYTTRAVGGSVLEQWQYEVTAGGRIWYCPAPDKRIVWIVRASPRHPKETE